MDRPLEHDPRRPHGRPRSLDRADRFAVFSAFNNITSKTFFPHLISSPFMTGLRIAFTASLILCLIAAAASWARGKRYVHDDESVREAVGATELLSEEALAT
jgi:hypothetical protein